MIVIDIGCATLEEYPQDTSTDKLIERFKPKYYYGFDPSETVVSGKGQIDSTFFEFRRAAAWVSDGLIGYDRGWNRLRNSTREEPTLEQVPCFDLATFLASLPDDDIVLKIDAEGAEYTLLPYLHEAGADARLDLILVEWHGEPLDIDFRCPVEEW